MSFVKNCNLRCSSSSRGDRSRVKIGALVVIIEDINHSSNHQSIQGRSSNSRPESSDGRSSGDMSSSSCSSTSCDSRSLGCSSGKRSCDINSMGNQSWCSSGSMSLGGGV